MLILPDFLKLPDYNPKIFTLVKDNQYNKYILLEHSEIFFNYPSDAYYYACNVLGGEVVFNPEDFKENGIAIAGSFIEKRDNENSGRIIFSYNPEGKQKSLENNYAYFLELNEKYLTNPEDWVNAYQWVQHHPAFYHRNIAFPEYWIMDDGWNNAYIYVDKDEDGKSRVLLEHGEWLPSINKKGETYCHTVPSHDYRLDVEAETFEEAYVLFAHNVNNIYDIKGMEKENY